MPERKKLPRSRISQLGGFAAAQAMTAEQRSARARKGAAAVMEKYGRGHFVRLGLRSGGYDVEVGGSN